MMPSPNRQDIVIDRVKTTLLPPAGVRTHFRVLGRDGKAVRRLTSQDVEIINDEKNTAFGLGGEGGSVSEVGVPSSFVLVTVLALDMSDSIHGAGSVDAVIDSAIQFVVQLVETPSGNLKHNVAIVAFGRPEVVEIIQDFTQDVGLLKQKLEALRTAPPRGSTDLYGAYSLAARLANGAVPQSRYEIITAGIELVESFVVILTDGTHEAGLEESLRETALADKQMYPTTFYSIGIKGAYDESKLKELASSEHHFVLAENASELGTVFGGIVSRVEGAAVSNYVIGVCTPVSLGQPTFTLKIDVDGLKASTTVAYSTDNLTGNTSSCDPADIATRPPGPPVCQMIEILPASIQLNLGETIQLVATGKFSDGNSRDVTNDVTWTAQTPSILDVNASGLVTAVAIGEASVTAELDVAEDVIQGQTICGYPGTSASIATGELFPGLSWAGAFKPDGSMSLFSVEEFHCSETYKDYTTLNFIVGAGWCPNCPAYRQRIEGIAAELESAGGLLVFLEVQNNDRSPADSENANGIVNRYVQSAVGWRVGDNDSSPMTRVFSRSITAIPDAFVVRRSDMKVIAHQRESQSHLDFVGLATDPSAN